MNTQRSGGLLVVGICILLAAITTIILWPQRDMTDDVKRPIVIASPSPPRNAVAHVADQSPQTVAVEWIAGTWSSAAASCDPATMITFDMDGNYVGTGLYGRFRIAGANLLRWGEVRLDIDAGADETHVDDLPRSTPVARRGDWLDIDGRTYVRCSGA